MQLREPLPEELSVDFDVVAHCSGENGDAQMNAARARQATFAPIFERSAVFNAKQTRNRLRLVPRTFFDLLASQSANFDQVVGVVVGTFQP